MKTCNILGVEIAVTNMARVVAMIGSRLESWRGKYICVSNAHTSVMSHDNKEYREIQNNAVLALPDGGPLVSYAHKKGFPQAQRVTGPDLMDAIFAASGDNAYRHFFYGSTEQMVNLLQQKLKQKYPDVHIVGAISPPFRALTDEEDNEYCRQINDARPDIVWVGLGAPKQEIWMSEHHDRINALMIGVGTGFEYHAQVLKRAPMFMQRNNLEWLYRMVQNPKRYFKRAVVVNVRFLWHTVK